MSSPGLDPQTINASRFATHLHDFRAEAEVLGAARTCVILCLFQSMSMLFEREYWHHGWSVMCDGGVRVVEFVGGLWH
jgi:hypothetical protein